MSEKSATVLIVDDTPDNVSVLNATLRGDYKIKAAPNGERALTVMRQEPTPDIVLLDIMMPGMDGYEVCRRLKADPATAAIPVIFITAKSDEVDETRGFELGAVDYITKPVKPAVVSARVATHLKIRRMQHELERRNQALQEAARLRDDVERITQHDLRSPLNVVISAPPILSGNYPFSETDRRLLDAVEKAGHKILNMINRSLDLYKMETGNYSLAAHPMDLLPLLHAVAREAAAAPAAKGKEYLIHIEGQPPENEQRFSVVAEEMLCYPMFSNLLLNAFEASPEGTTVGVDLVRSEDGAEVRITNYGAVPNSIRANFFDKYVTSGKARGTGLGTYSAKLSAETQGGAIRLEALEGERTRIVVSLPTE